MPRDVGVGKVYEAETAWRRRFGGAVLTSLVAVDEYLGTVLPPAISDRLSLRVMRASATVTVAHCDVRRHEDYTQDPSPFWNEIHIAVALPTNPGVLLHEVAHALRGVMEPAQGHLHDAEYRRTMLWLVRAHVGEAPARWLDKLYREKGLTQ